MSILQPANVVTNYCFQHNAQFVTERAYADHMEHCEELLKISLMCPFVEKDKMCQQRFLNAGAIVQHMLLDHNVLVCGRCGRYFDDTCQFEVHEHTHDDVFNGKCLLRL